MRPAGRITYMKQFVGLKKVVLFVIPAKAGIQIKKAMFAPFLLFWIMDGFETNLSGDCWK